MTPYVVDSSAAVKWVVPEPGWQNARFLLSGAYTLFAVDLIDAEVGNILWKKTQPRAGVTELTEDEARTALNLFLQIPIAKSHDSILTASALELAIELKHPVYDMLYLALALRSNCQLVTADTRLIARLAISQYANVAVDLSSITS